MDRFEAIAETLNTRGAAAVFEDLASDAIERKQYRELFSTRLMQARHQLALPLIETEPGSTLPDSQRSVYEAALREAARETGGFFLAGGDIVSAWPYFRAIGETAPVASAIEKYSGNEHAEAIIAIAFQEEVNPRKGFQLILEHMG